jgi:cellulose biosynthesis protein BcsQ
MIITVANWKGGVGKTTLAIGVADAFIAVHEANVSVVDLDPQATASQALLGEVEFATHKAENWNLYGLLKDRLSLPRPGARPQVPTSTTSLNNYRRDFLHFIRARSGVDLRLYPNSPDLWNLEVDEYRRDNGLGLGRAIKRLLAEEATDGRIVVVDCPPGQSLCTLAAIRSSDVVLCPITPDQFAFWGMDLFSEYMEKYAPETKLRFVVTRFKPGKASQPWLEIARNTDKMLRTEGTRDPALFSERGAVMRRVSMSRRKPRELKGIYGTECADQLRKIVNAIREELDPHG